MPIQEYHYTKYAFNFGLPVNADLKLTKKLNVRLNCRLIALNLACANGDKFAIERFSTYSELNLAPSVILMYRF